MVIADTSILEMALVGYAAERQKIGQKITELQQRLAGRAAPAGVSSDLRTHKSTISPEGRRRIAAAQRKRWQEVRRQAAEEEKHQEEAKAKRLAGLAKARRALAAARKTAANKTVSRKKAPSTKTSKKAPPATTTADNTATPASVETSAAAS
jgi:hypothetical protein